VTEVRVFTVSREQLRHELAADLSRGGYVYRASEREGAGERYFDKYLVLSRPGLLARSARLMADLIPEECERIAVTGVAAGSLGSALAQETGVPLLLGLDGGGKRLHFGGESFAGVKVVLLEDVVFTGQRALAGIQALDGIGADVLAAVCLLDREAGGAQRLADAGHPLRALYAESELLANAHDPEL
jgi:orotate phosphoribosyltransferase